MAALCEIAVRVHRTVVASSGVALEMSVAWLTGRKVRLQFVGRQGRLVVLHDDLDQASLQAFPQADKSGSQAALRYCEVATIRSMYLGGGKARINYVEFTDE